jgi:hypothetical protein
MSMLTPWPGELSWRKAARSANNGACVEVATAPGRVAVRDSKDPDGNILWYSATAWRSFLAQAKQGFLDYPGRPGRR